MISYRANQSTIATAATIAIATRVRRPRCSRYIGLWFPLHQHGMLRAQLNGAATRPSEQAAVERPFDVSANIPRVVVERGEYLDDRNAQLAASRMVFGLVFAEPHAHEVSVQQLDVSRSVDENFRTLSAHDQCLVEQLHEATPRAADALPGQNYRTTSHGRKLANCAHVVDGDSDRVSRNRERNGQFLALSSAPKNFLTHSFYSISAAEPRFRHSDTAASTRHVNNPTHTRSSGAPSNSAITTLSGAARSTVELSNSAPAAFIATS